MIVQVRDKSGWDQDSNGAHSEKWFNSEHIFKREVTEFSDDLDAFCSC